MKRSIVLSTVLLSAALIGCDTTSTTPNPSPSANNTRPDNTGVNERDRAPSAKTPIDQDENQADVDRTAEIRRRVLAEENMSVNARNAKIITSQGKVALRGPVDSVQEKETIEKIAHDVAGQANVVSELEVTEK